MFFLDDNNDYQDYMFGIYLNHLPSQHDTIKYLLLKNHFQPFRNCKMISEYINTTKSSMTYFTIIDLLDDIKRETVTLKKVKHKVIYNVLNCPHTDVFHRLMALNIIACDYFSPRWYYGKINIVIQIIIGSLCYAIYIPPRVLIHLATFVGLLIILPYVSFISLATMFGILKVSQNEEDKENEWIRNRLKEDKIDEALIFELLTKSLEKLAKKISLKHSINAKLEVAIRRESQFSDTFVKIWGFKISDLQDEELAQTSSAALSDLRDLLEPKDKGKTYFGLYELFN